MLMYQRGMKMDLRCHGVIQNDVHPPPVYLVYGGPPLFNRSEMVIQKGQVQGRVCIGAPWQIEVRTSGYVETLTEPSDKRIKASFQATPGVASPTFMPIP